VGEEMPFEKLIEEKIKEAIEKGEFDNLPGKGKPIDLSAYFSTPEDVRLAYSVLKSAGVLPQEAELQKEIESLKERLARCNNEDECHSIRREIESKTLKLNLMIDSNRRKRSR
jgi:DnaJ homologue, subfamily C, member 28, conserved domain